MTRTRAVTFTAGAAGSVFAYALARGDHRVWAYLLVASVVVGVGVIVDRGARFEPRVVALLGAALVLHLCGGLVPGPDESILYDQWLLPRVVKVDQLVHFVNCAALTVACASILRRWLVPSMSPAGPAFAAALMASGLGAINELFEFLASLALHDLAVGGYDNTGWDLVFNLAGAITAATWLVLRGSPRSDVHDVADGDRVALPVARLDDQVTALVDIDG